MGDEKWLSMVLALVLKEHVNNYPDGSMGKNAVYQVKG